MTHDPSTRKKSIVPLNRTHVRQGLVLGLFTALLFTINDVVQHGLTLRTVVLGIASAVVLTLGSVWASWHDDNRLERDLRSSRRAERAHARAKTR